jgi:hypothetical protein
MGAYKMGCLATQLLQSGGWQVASKIGPLAQLVEQQTLNLRVRGSIPLRLIPEDIATEGSDLTILDFTLFD